MTFWEAVLLGVIQGIFMFFPVSSTSHLALMQHYLAERGSALPSPESPEMILFDLVVHVGTLISIAVVFRESLGQYISLTWRGINEWFSSGEVSPIGGLYIRLTLLGLFTVLVTGVIGLSLRAMFEAVFANPLFMAGSLTVLGGILWWTDVLPARKVGLRNIGIWVALAVGIGQGLALMPGLSRSGMTIAFALFMGLQRRWAAEYSFFVAFPTILAATGVEAFRLLLSGDPLTITPLAFATGFTVAALVGIVALRIVIKLLYDAKFRFFSYYVWALAIVVVINVWWGNL